MPLCTAPEGYYYASDSACPEAGGTIVTSNMTLGLVDLYGNYAYSGSPAGGPPQASLPPYGSPFPGSTPPITNAPGGNPCNIPGLNPTTMSLLGCGPQVSLDPGQLPSAGTMQVYSAAACPIGYTLRKKPKRCASRYGECVPKRHMNSLNPHALRRATRRLSGFFSHVKSAEKAVRHSLGHVARTTHRRGCTYCGKSGRSCKCG